MRAAQSPEPARAESRAILLKATLRAAQHLGLSQKETAGVLGVSAATMSRLASGGRALEPESREGECALLLVRIFRALDALLGGREQDLQVWFRAPNTHVGGVPAQRVQTIAGLVHVAEYLDAMRGKL